MIAYLLGVALACAVAAVLPGLGEVLLFDRSPWVAMRECSWAMVWMCVTQVLAAGLAADVLHALWPKAALARGRFTLNGLKLGVISGAVGSVWMLIGAAISLRWLGPTSMLEPIGAGVLMGAACVLVLSLSARRRADACAGCGYDLVLLTPSSKGVCPECGRDQFAV